MFPSTPLQQGVVRGQVKPLLPQVEQRRGVPVFVSFCHSSPAEQNAQQHHATGRQRQQDDHPIAQCRPDQQRREIETVQAVIQPAARQAVAVGGLDDLAIRRVEVQARQLRGSAKLRRSTGKRRGMWRSG